MFTDRRANSRRTKRVRQPWPKDRAYRILSLDGGGIKGVFSAEFLRLCEAELAKGVPIRKHFDCIAGTSTGGIIALGLSLDMPTAEIMEFYTDDGRKIFPPQPKTFMSSVRRSLSSFVKPQLVHGELESALRRRFGEHLLGEANTRLVIPSFMMPKTEIAVFKTDHHRDFGNDHLTPMWRVARSTSAAPTYLKGLEDKESGKVFLDGGLWANNPVMIAIVDALSCYDLSPEQIDILSIGTGNSPFELKTKDIFGGLFAWREVIKAAMFLTSDNATAQAGLLLGPEKCLRIEPKDEEARVELDDYDRAFKILPASAQRHFSECRADVARFFGNQVLPRDRHYTA